MKIVKLKRLNKNILVVKIYLITHQGYVWKTSFQSGFQRSSAALWPHSNTTASHPNAERTGQKRRCHGDKLW